MWADFKIQYFLLFRGRICKLYVGWGCYYNLVCSIVFFFNCCVWLLWPLILQQVIRTTAKAAITCWTAICLEKSDAASKTNLMFFSFHLFTFFLLPECCFSSILPFYMTALTRTFRQLYLQGTCRVKRAPIDEHFIEFSATWRPFIENKKECGCSSKPGTLLLIMLLWIYWVLNDNKANNCCMLFHMLTGTNWKGCSLITSNNTKKTKQVYTNSNRLHISINRSLKQFIFERLFSWVNINTEQILYLINFSVK